MFKFLISQKSREDGTSKKHHSSLTSPIKICIVGDSYVGKSCLVKCLSYGHPSKWSEEEVESMHATIGVDWSMKKINIFGNTFVVIIWDPLGVERFFDSYMSLIRRCDAVVGLYDATQETTFDTICNQFKALKDQGQTLQGYFLCSTMADLARKEGIDVLGNVHKVQAFKNEYGIIQVYSTSNTTGENIEEMFQDIVAYTVIRRTQKIGLFCDLHDYFLSYEKACAEGTNPIFRTRLMLVGHSGVGKTNVARRLLGKEFQSTHISTNGIDANITGCEVNITNAINWKHTQLSSEDIAVASLREYILKNVKKHVENSCNAMPIKDKLHAAVSDSARPRPGFDLLNDMSSGDIQSNYHENGDNENNGGTENICRFSIWDFSGQYQFYVTHQTFLTSRAIYLLVINMKEDLDNEVNTFRQGRYEKTKSTSVPQTVKDFIDFWLSNIHTHSIRNELSDTATIGKYSKGSNNASTVCPPVIVVGTHKDKVTWLRSNALKYVQDYFQSIGKYLDGKEYFNHVYPHFFAVDNKNGDTKEYQHLRDTIIKLASEQSYWGEERPIKWLELERRILKLEPNQSEALENTITNGIVALEDIEKIAEDLSMTREEISAFLTFQHKIGDFIYFNQPNLSKNVVTKPQVLIDLFKAVVTVSDFRREVVFPGSKVLIKKLDEEGILNVHILDFLWKGQDKEFLLKLMQKFDLVIPLATVNGNLEGEVIVQNYMIPCLMPISSVEDRKVNLPSLAPVLFYRFNGEFMPVGLFHRLIARLSKSPQWKLIGSMFHNYAKYQAGPDLTEMVTVFTSGHWIRISAHAIIQDGAVDPALVSLNHIQTITTSHINAIIRMYHPSLRYGICYSPCESKQEFKTSCLVDVGEAETIYENGMSCIICPKHHEGLAAATCTAWFREKSNLPSGMINRELLCKISKHVINDETLLDLGNSLNVPYEYIASCRTDKTINLAGLHILKYWFDTEGFREGSRTVLRIALESSKLAYVVEKLNI